MYVEDVQKNADPPVRLVEQGILFLNDFDHFAITRRNNDARFIGDGSLRIPEKVEDEQ